MSRWPLSFEERFWSRVYKGDCWIWQGSRDGDGYGTVYFRGSAQLVHRVSWILLKGEIPDGLFVLHRCDNPPCLNPDHLFLGTQLDNMQDCAKKKRLIRDGEHNGHHKLTWDQVREIRKQLIEGKSAYSLSLFYGVTKTSIHSIKYYETWKE